MTPVEVLLSRLRGVKGRSGAFTARCPAHEDKTPSLAVRELDDGRVLLHCFGGCETELVLGAIGLTFDDLYPETRTGDHKPKAKPAFYASDLIRILSFEALVVSICASDLRKGQALSPEDHERLLLAQQRIEEVMHHAGL